MVAPVAKAAVKVARKAAGDPGPAILIGVLALVMFTNVVKKIPKLPGVSGAVETVRKPFDWTAEAFDELLNPPSGQFSPSDPLAELRQDAMVVKRFTNTSTAFLGGIVQGDIDDPEAEFYSQVHYDAQGIPIAVPVEINRTARLWGGRVGEGIRGAIGDWSLPGF